MTWAPTVEGETHRTVELGELVFDSQSRSIAARFFVRGRHLAEAEIRHGLEKTAKVQCSVEEANLLNQNKTSTDVLGWATT